MGKSEFLFPVFATEGHITVAVTVLTAHPYPASGFWNDLNVSFQFVFQFFPRDSLICKFAIVGAIQELSFFQAAWIYRKHGTTSSA